MQNQTETETVEAYRGSQEQFLRHKNAIIEILATIHNQVVNNNGLEFAKINWGHAGDMGRLEMLLRQAVQ